MAELDAIVDTLKRQRQDLEDSIESTASRKGEAAELLGKIEDLRRRVEETRRRCEAAAAEAKPESEK